ncbi:hypothetical protein KXV43_003948 [Aspergillus fumigatus]|nr:hypothetical protein KXV43_003948 [Aspergillus fumigatus]
MNTEESLKVELEQRLASSKGDAKRKDIERKLLVQKIEAENRKLRDLLIFSGMQPSVIEMYLHMDGNSNTTRNIAIPALQGSEEAIELPYQNALGSAEFSNRRRTPFRHSSKRPR